MANIQIAPETWRKAKKLYESGLKLREIKEKTGLLEPTVSRKAAAERWKRPGAEVTPAAAPLPPLPPAVAELVILPGDEELTPLEYLTRIMRNSLEGAVRRDWAASTLLPYTAAKPAAASAGKKEQRQEAADKAASGKFATPQAPRLVVSK